MRLAKGIYGWETNAKKTPFGLLNDQKRIDHVVKNGGWFNFDHQKIGTGDLSMKDLANIAKNIPEGEAFFVLSEVDAIWDMPKDLDRSEPGSDYVLKTATWLVSRSTGIVRVRDDISRGDMGESSGITYSRIPRAEVIASFKKPKDLFTGTGSKKLSEIYDELQKFAGKQPATKASSTYKQQVLGSLTYPKTRQLTPQMPQKKRIP